MFKDMYLNQNLQIQIRKVQFNKHLYTRKKCWVVLTQFWVKYGQTQPLGKKCHLKM